MADTRNINEQRNPNQTMQREQAKSEVSGQRQDEREQAKSEVSGQRPDERDQLDQQRHEQRQEKGAIGGGGETRGQTGEPGRARDELDQNRKDPAGQQR